MYVIGAGFGRTGTLSLKGALEELGCGPCYHMFEVRQHPEHVALWQAAAEGAPVDWARLLDGYNSAVDWPACSFYEELMRVHPEAKVVLTVRDPGRWWDSALSTIYPSSTGRLAPPSSPQEAERRHMIETLIWNRTFGGRFEDRDHAIAVYERHNQEVKERVPAERLLIYEVAQGWGPLCRFLGLEEPHDTPFPRVNDTAEFLARVQGQPPAPVEPRNA